MCLQTRLCLFFVLFKGVFEKSTQIARNEIKAVDRKTAVIIRWIAVLLSLDG